MPRKSLPKLLCPHCQKCFRPDARNRHHQVFCSQPACRQRSKALSQERWWQKSANTGYFGGPEQTERVRRWRAEHPGYWRKKARPVAPDAPPLAPPRGRLRYKISAQRKMNHLHPRSLVRYKISSGRNLARNPLCWWACWPP